MNACKTSASACHSHECLLCKIESMASLTLDWWHARAVAKLAEDPDFHLSLKLEPGDIELIHNP